MKDERDDERVDLNLDTEAVGESPLSAEELAALTGGAVEAAGEETPEAIQDALMAKLGKLQAEKDDLYQTLVRRQADFENFRKRVERERQEDARRGAAILLESLLPVLDAQIRRLDTELFRQWGPDPRVQRLLTIPGIGPFLAILLVLELGDVHRFPSAKHVASYVGLTPRIRASAVAGPVTSQGKVPVLGMGPPIWAQVLPPFRLR